MVDRPLVRRRTAVVGAFGGLAVAVLATGCDHGDDLTPPRADPSSATNSSTGTPSSPAPEQTADEALVDEVLGRLATALSVLISARKTPTLRMALVPLIRAHRRHIEVLDGDLPPGSPGASSDPVAALRAVRRGEQQLQAALVDAADRAESGALARLLASMSASVTQHLILLPRKTGA